MALQDAHQLTIDDPVEPNKEVEASLELNFSGRAQWLRAAVLGANDGLVSTATLMIGVGAVKNDARAMVLFGFAGLV